MNWPWPHCHFVSATPPSRSVTSAVKAVSVWGRRADRVTVPSSFTLVTSTVTASVPTFIVSSVACTSTV